MYHAPETRPFADFAPSISLPTPLRRAITAAYRLPEPEAVRPLLETARVPEGDRAAVAETARMLVNRLRQKRQRGGVDGLVKEYSLSSQEGVALMCLAEALLRIPDKATRDALIRDKIATGDWRSHLGDGRSIFVNAATWGLVVSGKLVAPINERGLGASLSGLIKRSGEPVIRSGVNMAMQMMGEQFVTGQTIDEALGRASRNEAAGFTYSYDMLGEAAMTMADAERYFGDYERALHAIGKASDGRGVYAGPGISIKLSALHPRYARAQAGRVMAELLPRVRELALLARRYDIGFNIDAEEADRLELSLDILEALALDNALVGWDGLGFVAQAYGKRCPFVIDWIVDLAKRSGHRIMVRLVKGAYWDSEIKRTQVDGLADFAVFTRKVHTDVSYLACARKLLAARDVLFPQFATHNAQTLATIYRLAGDEFAVGDYEFQCLHGMGEELYEEVVGPDKLHRPCRIYAPVGSHETLLAYLVRRLLENGANSSFVNRIWDEGVPLDDLVADPVEEAERIVPLGSPHPLIALPADLYPDRRNACGLDLSDETVLATLSRKLRESVSVDWRAEPIIAGRAIARAPADVTNPGDQRDVVGQVVWALPEDAAYAARKAADAFGAWAQSPVEQRAGALERAADLLEQRMEPLLGLIMREAGKSLPNAIAEVREAVDFLRYYAEQVRATFDADVEPLGPMVCISPWNFPLAIFTGEVAAALVAGNTVLAKPAEETPLIAAQAVGILHEAGIPEEVLQLLPGDGAIGAALVGAPEICGVIFTGSTEVAKLIQRQLAERTLPDGSPLRLIAETGGQNAMVVDSSALPEQVVRDVVASAFDSAGQRCSALRILCVQDDIADELLSMLKGAMAELSVGPTDELRVDVGPVITRSARKTIETHVDRMREAGHAVERLRLGEDTKPGTFVPPTIVEIEDIGQLGREVFGPVLHVLRYARTDLGKVMGQINSTGYGLTFGLHSRIDETIAEVTAHAQAGNIYINRNVIGAIVGVQPFGGRDLSGTGPKAGGPLYIGRLVRNAARSTTIERGPVLDPDYEELARFVRLTEDAPAPYGHKAPRLDSFVELPGPVGEQNLYGVYPRGRVLLLPATAEGLRDQLLAIFATGNLPFLPDDDATRALAANLPASVAQRLQWTPDWQAERPFAQILIEDTGKDIRPRLKAVAAQDGPIPIVQLGIGKGGYRTDWLLEEIALSIDTTAAGGNASLMAVA
ncbi:trifunctional transcriptional regulator/proline dehydrogenase/L-glutamate gamma-semialdehyde dehydrogenase [Parasphingopyxis algicola]|uniref:trifunctional transcriptional regulator/proline dehydrogenase/L-glutamate gamma-semialdehyde dehydrogenase n=1 Tax=Parasphingopyxis algicola TaxID=2026624 RepID=UPI0015A346C5|nr:trifunctional transcriptional regulator/proline dehydrogenase/L-glutamate gamma-semialdehyde dehydrogenase [Parasphingopyxis algicola]QLC25215.1 trifunctional transcriptional regulator/proline dehydrogenase/L-glutamate gamma-semialdehyde dehydrogenase [Parasphingopyxis algicola]